MEDPGAFQDGIAHWPTQEAHLQVTYYTDASAVIGDARTTVVSTESRSIN